MTFKSSSELMGDALERARNRWRQLRSEPLDLPPAQPPPPPFTIAISRECGARDSEVAVLLGKRLDWPVYDREVLGKIVEATHVRAELLESADEKRTPWLTDCLQAFLRGPTAADVYVAHLAKVIVSLATHGDCVIVGRGAGFLLPVKSTLNVRLVAPLETRVRRICESLQLSERDARKHVQKTDRERWQFVKDHFQRDSADVHLYDLALNTGIFSDQQCTELIVKAVEQRTGKELARHN